AAGAPGLSANYAASDFVAVVNLTDRDLAAPRLGLGTVVERPLQTRGTVRLPDFGGAGGIDLDALPAGGVWATLMPDDFLGARIRVDGFRVTEPLLEKGEVVYVLSCRADIDGDGLLTIFDFLA